MTAHSRTATFHPRLAPAIETRPATRRTVLIGASFLLEAVIVLGLAASSLGVASSAYPNPDPGRQARPAPIAPVADRRANASIVLEPAPAPAPAPED